MKKIYLHAVNGFAEIKSRIRNVLSGEEGMGTVEVILIILVLIGLVIIFKNQLTSLVQTIFSKITSQAGSIKPERGKRCEKSRVGDRSPWKQQFFFPSDSPQ